MMDFRMETFLAACRFMNFTKAAKSLNMTQPAVSQHIRYLEDFYQAKLIEFHGKKMYLTEAGTILYQAAVTMENDDHYLINELKNLAEKKKQLIFGATLTIGEFVIAGSLSNYLNHDPDVEIRMMIGNTTELLEKLDLGEIDFAIVEGNFNKKNYESLLYSQERYIPVCGKNHLFQKNPEQLSDLLTERIIIREKGSGTREILEKNLESRNLSVEDFRYVTEIGGMNAIKCLVESGCGITFLYEAAVEKEVSNGNLREIRLEDFDVRHDFTFIWNKGSVFSDRYREIFNHFKE